MLPLPSREALATLTQAAHAIVPLQSLGFVSSLDDARVSLLFVHANGVNQHVVQRSDVPTVLRPSIDEARQEATTGSRPVSALEHVGDDDEVLTEAVDHRLVVRIVHREVEGNSGHVQLKHRHPAGRVALLERSAGLWNEEHAFFFDAIRYDSERVPLETYSMVGLVPLLAATVVEAATLAKLPIVMQTVGNVLNSREFLRSILPSFVEPGHDGTRLLSLVNRDRLPAILQRVLDEDQFLSEYGVRSLSRAHGQHPYTFSLGGQQHEVSYLPGVSNNRMFGGNSNWRGPIWVPMNFLLIQALATFARYYGDSFTMECPTGSGRMLTLAQVADELAARLTRVFVRDENGRRAVFGENGLFQDDPQWRDYVPFHEYFHGDTGEGVGAGHQTGWTALVALLIQHRGQLSFERAPVEAASESHEGKVA